MKLLTMKSSNNIIVTIDNAGSIGLKENDQVQVDYETLSYLTIRNAVMENLTQNTRILGATLANFCGEENYNDLINGLKRIQLELGYQFEVVSSTESNFTMKESAFSVTIIGEQVKKRKDKYGNYAVVGIPMVGEEILSNLKEMVTFQEVLELLNNDDVSRIFTVGSKGINDRLKKYTGKAKISNHIDLNKSAGPSTCIIIEYNKLDNIRKEIADKITVL